MFWLDAHFSGGFTSRGDVDCPLITELDAIAAAKLSQVAILVDDVRCLGRTGYPALNDVIEKCGIALPGKRVRIEHDILFLD
jgi:hypothetical protein